MFLTIGVLAAACTYDESELSGQIDDINVRIEKLKGDVEVLNTQLGSLNEIAKGNPITKVTKDSDGKYVITYMNNQNEEKTIVLATMDQMVKVPMLGVKQESETSPYYWTIGDEWLKKDGQKVPVSGFAPEVTVDAEGYWTIDGERIKDFNGNDLYAHDGESCLFKSIETDEDGDLVITQGNGNVITIPVQGAINLTLSVGINTPVLSTANPVDITYEVTGVNSKDAMVAIADAQGLGATINRETKTITVTFASTFTSGYLVVIASDLEDHMVIRPIFFSTGSGEGGGGSDEPLDYYPIYNAQDLVAFASGVNAGTGMENMDAKLMTDIDMSGVTSWTPIGNGHFFGSLSGAATEKHTSRYSGVAYKAVFDGQGNSIRNFKTNRNFTDAQTVYGLFGILDGATVKNLTMGAPSGDESILEFSAVDTIDVAVIAGACMASTIENCVNYVPMNAKGCSVTQRNTMAAFAGFVYASAESGSVLRNLTNYGAITAANGSNTDNGGKSVMVAGIAGVTNGTQNISGDVRNHVYNCVNHGNMTSSTPRTSGVVAAVNQYTTIELCKNYGNQTNSNAGTRVGMITATMNNYTKMINCENHGDAIMTDSGTGAQVGGLVCLLNSATASITGGGNYGRIISNIKASQTSYRGTLVANFSNFESVSGVVAGGGSGTYNGGNYVMENITQSNYMTYIGKYSTANASKITNIIYGGENAVGIKSAADLVEFANLVNSGQSYAKFQDEAGGVNLLKDIDMSSVASWTPIGYATCPAGANDAAITGNAFSGRFSGNGFRIKNLRLVASGTEADKNYGLFGTLAPGATVENIIFDESCSLVVTATAKMACGVAVGYAYDATVRDIQSYAKMTFNGKAGNGVFMSMGVVGQIYCNTLGVTVDSVHNYGDIVANNSDNTNAGAAAYHAAGIVGFAHALQTSEEVNTISSCSNYGDMTSQFARTSGIVAAANRNTEIFNCENNGNQVNSFPTSGGARLGNITCNISNTCSMTECKNYGNLTSTTSGRCGGITSLPNEVTFTNCANYGVILTDDNNRGVFYGYNGGTTGTSARDYVSKWINCTAGGKVGTYNNNAPVYDSYSDAEKEKYLGKYRSTAQTYTDIVYLIGTTDPSAGTGTAEYNILFIGNSFTKDAVEHLPGLLAGAGNKKVNMVHIYYGGQLISGYNSLFSDATGFTCFSCAPGIASWSNKTGVSIKDCCKMAKWDVVTIQEHTGNKAAWSFTSTSQSDVKSLIDKVKAAMPTGSAPKFYYIMSQAYYNMAKIGSGSQPSITWTDQEGMYDVIVAFAKQMMATGYFEDVIATGTMLQNLRTSSLNTSMDLTRDGYHMDNGLARYGAACTVFEKIITPKFSTTLDGNTFRYNVTNTSDTQYSTPVTSSNAPMAIQAARYAIQKPYEITDMSKKEDNSVGNMDYEEGNKE